MLENEDDDEDDVMWDEDDAALSRHLKDKSTEAFRQALEAGLDALPDVRRALSSSPSDSQPSKLTMDMVGSRLAVDFDGGELIQDTPPLEYTSDHSQK